MKENEEELKVSPRYLAWTNQVAGSTPLIKTGNAKRGLKGKLILSAKTQL